MDGKEKKNLKQKLSLDLQNGTCSLPTRVKKNNIYT